jgi:hypothetical protein
MEREEDSAESISGEQEILMKKLLDWQVIWQRFDKLMDKEEEKVEGCLVEWRDQQKIIEKVVELSIHKIMKRELS